MRAGNLAKYVLTVWIILLVAGAAGAQYGLEGSAEIHTESAHIRDSVVVTNPEDRDTWITQGYGEILLQHHFEAGVARALLDQGILIFSTAGTGSSNTGPGTAGSGADTVAGVELQHELYQAYLQLDPAPWARVVAGRQFHWEGEGVHRTSPVGLFFSVTDGLHPRPSTAVTQPGFDGIRLELGVDMPVTVSGAVALQDLFANNEPRDAPLANARYALHGWINGGMDTRLGLTWVGQNETMQRTGAFLTIAPGPFVFGMEAAVEMFDPRERTVTASGLFGIRGEYTHQLQQEWYISLISEYHYNGLAGIYPEDRTRVPVTTDGAAAFPRPGRHYGQYGFSLGRDERWRNTNTFMSNLSDGSTLAEHTLSLLIFDPAMLSIAILWISGDGESEFGVIREDFLLRLSAGIRF